MSCLIVWCKSNKKVIVPQTFLLLSPTPVCAIVGGYGILPYPRSHQTIFPQKPTQPNHLWASVKSVGEYSPPETSVNSVNSVGEPYAPKPSVCICAICGRIIKWAAWVWQGCHTLLSVFCGRTRTLNFCGFRAFRGRTRIPWGENTKRAWRNAMPSYVSYVDAWVWQGCHTLL